MPKNYARCCALRSRPGLIELAHEDYQGAKLAEELDAKLAAARLAASQVETDSPPRSPAAARAELVGLGAIERSGFRSRAESSNR